MKTRAACACTLAMALALAGCGGQSDLSVADGTYPVPEGVPVREYAPVPLEGRSEIAFELVEDLVIGGDPNDPNTAFYQPTEVVAGENGNIFVVERGGKRVQMFAPDGRFLKTLGAEGQGPGEFQRPTAATIAGEHLVVLDSEGFRLSVWTDEGQHVADHAAALTSMPSRLAGLPDGRMVAVYTEFDLGAMTRAAMMGGAMPATTRILASYSAQFEQIARLMQVTGPPLPSPGEDLSDVRARTQRMIERMAVPRLIFAVGSERAVYATTSTEYQVLSMTPEGEMNWALRVALDRRPFPESSKETRVRVYARDDPALTIDDFDWPELDRAIAGTIRSDGHGRLYVYPLFAGPAAEETTEEEGTAEGEETDEQPRSRPVDVYSPEGDLIVAGLATETAWSYARGDYVYQLRRDPESDETLVVRFRLVLNDAR